MRYRYTIDVLSPVHVGTGETLSPLEFIAGERFGVFDTHAFFSARPDRAETFTARLSGMPAGQIAALRLNDLLAGDEATNRDYWSYSALLEGPVQVALSKGRVEIRRAVKTPDCRFYIPATSLKGAIRTAIAYFEYREHTELLQELIHSAQHRQIQQQIFLSLRGENAVNDYLRAFSISDPEPIPAEDSLMLAWGRVLSAAIPFSDSQNLQRKSNFKQYPIFSEAIKPGAFLSGRLSLNHNLLTSKASATMRWTPHQSALSIESICRAVNTFAADICKWELDYFRQVESIDCKSIVRFYEGLSERVAAAQERSDTLFLSIGQGSGWHKMTVGLLLEKAVREGGMDKGQFDRIRTGEARKRQDFQYPKSRKLVMRGEYNVWLPFGWVALRLPDAPPAPKLVDMDALMAQRMATDVGVSHPQMQREQRRTQQPPQRPRQEVRLDAPPRRAEPLPVIPRSLPKPEPKVQGRPKTREGQQVSAEVLSYEGGMIRIRLTGAAGEELEFRVLRAFGIGEKIKVKVESLDAAGRVTKVRM